MIRSRDLELKAETATANQYRYVWKTDKSWAGACRKFSLGLTDGTTHVALFQFK